jgi:hypothetical protein
MSKRLDVLLAVKAMIAAALPLADVLGLDGSDASVGKIGAAGRVVIDSGDPGAPEVDLSPLTYWYQHMIPIDVGAYEGAGLSAEQVVDAMLRAIGAGISADRTLGGLCEWLDATAPTTEDLYVEGAKTARLGILMIVASYSTPNPLT